MSNISKNIKQFRISLEMSQAQLAEKLGITRQTVSSWERGVSMPDLQMLEALSQALDVDIESLIYGSTKRRPKKKVFPLTAKFVFFSLVIYFVLFIPVGGFVALPILKLIVGGTPANDFVIILYWGLLLLVGYIAICVALLTEYIIDSYSDGNYDESDKK